MPNSDYYSSFYLSLLSLFFLPFISIMMICVSYSNPYLFILLFIFLPIPTLCLPMHPVVGIMLIYVLSSSICVDYYSSFYLSLLSISSLPLVGIIMICVSYYHLFIYIIIHLSTYPYSLYLPYLWLV